MWKIEHPVPAGGLLEDALATPLKAQLIKKLTNVVKISANCNHFLALERNDTEPIGLWNHEKVTKWFETIRLGDYASIVKYQKIDGKKIEQADSSYLADVLGIMQEVEQDKLRFEVGRVRDGLIGECKVWGWGNNKWGQLGLYGGNNFPEPKQIPLPDLFEASQLQKDRDFIVNIECGKRQSAFITHKGEVWVTGNYHTDKPAGGATSDTISRTTRALSGGNQIELSELDSEERKAVMTLPGAYQVIKGSKQA